MFNKKKGFTLIELIIVIAIIGILVAIAVPRFADATQGARNRTVDAQAKQIASAVSQWYADKLEWPTNAANGDDVKKVAGLKASDYSKYEFSVDAANAIKVEYKWNTRADKYTGTFGTGGADADNGTATFNF